MTVCPKCGSHTIGGPQFISRYGREALRYVCVRCGYEMYGPTVEQQQQQRAERAGVTEETDA